MVYTFVLPKFNKIGYSGTPLNGHPKIVDTCDITDKFESPDLFMCSFVVAYCLYLCALILVVYHVYCTRIIHSNFSVRQISLE